ncbi:MAG: protein translocase subunit SecD [Sphaerochaetaceae bacterium]|jgi:preprotein translocase subunit SecD|nr:protein translocase subunit SecD [Sphaerochaetaceae bacterium]MDD3941106.1 protein translocase subunit SecD [Sphaerochaetaceae bacterium]MDX9939491.1 protein translocase subunit SecD [Sphaerochaetaceae bacterium]
MKKRGRLFIVLLVAVICGIFLYPTVKWYGFVPQETKDLATGSKLQIREYALGQATRDLRELKSLIASDPQGSLPDQYGFLIPVAKENYKSMKRDVPRSWNVESVFRGFYNEQGLFDALESHYRTALLELKTLSGKVLQLGLDLRGGMSILLEADVAAYEAKTGTNLSGADITALLQEDIAILNERIDQFGVTEPDIRIQGTDQILIEIPGAADPERVNSFLRGKGSLTFQIVDQELTAQLNTYFTENPGEAFTDAGQIKRPDFLPAGKVATAYYVNDAYGLDELSSFVVLNEEIGLDGIHIANAVTGSDPITGQPTVNFELDTTGGEIFYKLTSTNTNELMAVVQDGKVKAMATITEPIRNSVQIKGFGLDEARDLSIVLKTAALPIELIVVGQQGVGASLGEDTVRAGLVAILIGLGLVFFFMVVIYKGSGLIADVALLFNLIILLSVLSAFNLTLTLTSIAGLVLTVGMAVDANVIILERIKEELAAGKSDAASVKAGFAKAFWTIMDANVTTIIAALVLSQLGSGSIKGFANTLAVGIASSMFNALFVVKLMYDASLSGKNPRLSVSWRRK